MQSSPGELEPRKFLLQFLVSPGEVLGFPSHISSPHLPRTTGALSLMLNLKAGFGSAPRTAYFFTWSRRACQAAHGFPAGNPREGH